MSMSHILHHHHQKILKRPFRPSVFEILRPAILSIQWCVQVLIDFVLWFIKKDSSFFLLIYQLKYSSNFCCCRLVMFLVNPYCSTSADWSLLVSRLTSIFQFLWFHVRNLFIGSFIYSDGKSQNEFLYGNLFLWSNCRVADL
jgi:hypothetical protein